MPADSLKIGLVITGDEESDSLVELLTNNGAAPIHKIEPSDIEPQHISDSNVNVWLISVDDDSWNDNLDDLLDGTKAPVYISEPGTLSKQDHPDFWCANLLDRLYEITGIENKKTKANKPAKPPQEAKTDKSKQTVKSEEKQTDSKRELSDSLDELDVSATDIEKEVAAELLNELESLPSMLKEHDENKAEEKNPNESVVIKEPEPELERPKASVSPLIKKKTSEDSEIFEIPLLEDTANDVEFEDREDKRLLYSTPCWVIGASLGGPAAVKQFIECIPKDINASFIVAQHIDENFLPVLKEILTESSHLDVSIAQGVSELKAGKLYIAPLKGKIVFLKEGSILVDHSQKWSGPYSPCINDVVESTGVAYGPMSGAIIFSGMGDDGLLGARKMRKNGGLVWAQSPDTCADSSMPSSVIDNGEVDYVGTPEELAQNLVLHLREMADKETISG